MAAMRENKIRFGDAAWEMIRAEAEHEGVRPSQYVREATIAWAVAARARRLGEQMPEAKLIDAVRKLRRLDDE